MTDVNALAFLGTSAGIARLRLEADRNAHNCGLLLRALGPLSDASSTVGIDIFAPAGAVHEHLMGLRGALEDLQVCVEAVEAHARRQLGGFPQSPTEERN